MRRPSDRHRSAHRRSPVRRSRSAADAARGPASHHRQPRACRASSTSSPPMRRPQVRALALDALEGIDDVRAIDVAVDALRDGDVDVVDRRARCAARLGGRERPARACSTRLRRSPSIATRDARVRVAALDALSELPEHLVRADPRSGAAAGERRPVARRSGGRARMDPGVRRRAPRSRRCTSSSPGRASASTRSPRRAAVGVAAGARPRRITRSRRRESLRGALRPAGDVRSGDSAAAAGVPVDGRGDRRRQLSRAAGARLGGRRART